MAKVGFDLYTTEAEAIVRAGELGCKSPDGSSHTLVIEGTTYYMPCKSADSYNEIQQFADLEIEDCSDCCNCTPSQLTLVKMWNCTYLKLVESFIRSSEYGDSCLEDTIEKLHLYNSMFWLFQTNNAPTYPLNKYNSNNCSASGLMDTFASAVCEEVTCDMLNKFDHLIGTCCKLQIGEKFSYCELASKGNWVEKYNSEGGYQINDVIFYGNQYWVNTLSNNLNRPTSNPTTSGWEVCDINI